MDDGPNPTRARFSPVWALFGVAAIGLVAATVAAVPGELVGGEATTFEAANDLPRWAGLPLEATMHLGSFVASLAVAAAAALAGRSRLAIAAGCAWALARISGGIMKAAVGRPRPPSLLPDVVLRQHLPADNGFPSGHSANAAALAVVLGWAFPRWRVPLAVVAVLVGVARLYVGVHLPLDLVGGWCLGILCGLAVVTVLARLVPEDGPKVDDDVR